MRILSIESSCDETAVAIADTLTRTILSEVVFSHTEAMKKFGGIVPEVASREHLKLLPLAFHEALKKATLSIQEIDWITATQRPGLLGALLVGVSFAKATAFANGIPFTGLNHLEAHLFSPHLENPPAYPWIALVVSGGHTELYKVENLNSYEKLGETLDDAAGEAFDKVGKLLGLEYPAGPKIDQLVANEVEARTVHSFPRALPNDFDFSFSGLKTAVLLASKKMESGSEKEKVALLASAQEAILVPLVKRIQKACTEFGISNVVLAGGVACNSRLREKLPKAYFPKPKYCSDNAAMVAMLSVLYQEEGKLIPSSFSETAIAR